MTAVGGSGFNSFFVESPYSINITRYSTTVGMVEYISAIVVVPLIVDLHYCCAATICFYVFKLLVARIIGFTKASVNRK